MFFVSSNFVVCVLCVSVLYSLPLLGMETGLVSEVCR